MTRERRASLEARIIAERQRNPEPALFTKQRARGAWAEAIADAPRRAVHRTREATDDTWANSKRSRP